jgi:hypothetical protein
MNKMVFLMVLVSSIAVVPATESFHRYEQLKRRITVAYKKLHNEKVQERLGGVGISVAFSAAIYKLFGKKTTMFQGAGLISMVQILRLWHAYAQAKPNVEE